MRCVLVFKHFDHPLYMFNFYSVLGLLCGLLKKNYMETLFHLYGYRTLLPWLLITAAMLFQTLKETIH